MTEPFVAEIRMVAFNFSMRGWASCNGQLMQIRQNTALFALLGTSFGGDGRNTFGLPNLQGSFPMQQGTGPGLTPRELGEVGGSETATISLAELPAHSHALLADEEEGDDNDPSPSKKLGTAIGAGLYNSNTATVGALSPLAVSEVGGGVAGEHPNLQPYLVLNFQIALQGIFPSRP